MLFSNMKKLILITITALLIGCSSSKTELFSITDSFVESLQTTYESYGTFGALKYQKITSDHKYQITPIGRLINVKILEEVSSKEYRDLAKKLEKHYKSDSNVHDVYISEAGTIMIDCRDQVSKYDLEDE